MCFYKLRSGQLCLPQNMMTPFMSMLVCWVSTFSTQTYSLTLEQTITLALERDPAAVGNTLRSSAFMEREQSAGTWMDPKLSLTMANLPTDTWDTDQEAMTQFRLGVVQMLPRGDSISIKQQKNRHKAFTQGFLQQDRKAFIKKTVSQIWLENFLVLATLKLVEEKYDLVSQLVDTSKSNYRSGLSRSRQQDILQTQLQQTYLEDRILQLRELLSVNHAKLMSWVWNSAEQTEEIYDIKTLNHVELPNIDLLTKDFNKPTSELSDIEAINHHPKIKSIESKIDVSRADINLAKQTLKPQWAVSAAYGYRDDDPAGNNRADLFSFGVSMDLPLFTGNKQDRDIKAAVYESEAAKTEKHLFIREMKKQLDVALVKLQQLRKRYALYNESLLGQSSENAEAAYFSYTHDDGSFSDLVKSRVVELNAQIELLNIKVNTQKIKAQINYYYAAFDQEIMTQELQ